MSKINLVEVSKTDKIIINTFNLYLKQSFLAEQPNINKKKLNIKSLEQNYLFLNKEIETFYSFNLIKEQLIKNAWLKLFLMSVKKQTNFYKDYFNKNKNFYFFRIKDVLVDYMIQSGSYVEQQFIKDKRFDKELIYPTNTNKITKYWLCKNYYLAIKYVNPSLVKQIFEIAKNEYLDFINEKIYILENTNENFKNLYCNLKNDRTKILFINQLWKEFTIDDKGKLNGGKILEFKDDILFILNKSLSNKEIIPVSNLLDILSNLFIFNKDITTKTFLKDCIVILEPYHHINVVNTFLTKFHPKEL